VHNAIFKTKFAPRIFKIGIIMSLNKVLYKAYAKASGGRVGRAVSSDGVLDVTLTTPKEMGGSGDVGTNPEQLFAAGYSACFLGAMKAVSSHEKISVPADAEINGVVGFGTLDVGYGIEVELKISLPGLDRADAERLVHAAHQVCPYSNATRGNVDVTLTIV
jgi:lipoyl-dependent peroxiredoxin